MNTVIKPDILYSTQVFMWTHNNLCVDLLCSVLLTSDRSHDSSAYTVTKYHQVTGSKRMVHIVSIHKVVS